MNNGKLVVYFNQWFSSIYYMIKDLKNSMSNIEIVASSKNPNHVYKKVVDIFIAEDWDESGGNKGNGVKYTYEDFILKTLTDYHVDVFFIKKNARDLSKPAFMSKMIELGVTPVVEENTVLQSLEDKMNVYRVLQYKADDNDNKGIWAGIKRLIPIYLDNDKRLNNEQDIEIYDKICNIIKGTDEQYGKDMTWCFKLRNGEGGTSYRYIEPKKVDYESLYSYRTNSVSKDEALEIIKSTNYRGMIKEIMMMEVLDEPEISVDCYRFSSGEFISVCRSKIAGSRDERVFFNEVLDSYCNELGRTFNIKYGFNVQFRMKHTNRSKTYNNDNIIQTDKLRLLEINPRLSGGSYQLIGFNINMIELILKDVINSRENKRLISDIKTGLQNKVVTHVEEPINLD